MRPSARSMTRSSAIRASAALPGLFVPVLIDGDLENDTVDDGTVLRLYLTPGREGEGRLHGLVRPLQVVGAEGVAQDSGVRTDRFTCARDGG